MYRVLAVTCSSSDAYLAVIDVDVDTGGHEFVDDEPAKLSAISAGDHGDALARGLAEWQRTLTHLQPDAIVLLLPESAGRTRNIHSYWAPRCETETLVGLAAGLAGIPFDQMARATVRSRLGLQGKLDEAISGTPQGRYWGQRGLALLAARALAENAFKAGSWPTRSRG